tara:strand:+ start:184 stop:306 length:123 start_codon:yes stop_codon:yes gene_type:complete
MEKEWEIREREKEEKADYLNKKRAPDFSGALQQQNILTKH